MNKRIKSIKSISHSIRSIHPSILQKGRRDKRQNKPWFDSCFPPTHTGACARTATKGANKYAHHVTVQVRTGYCISCTPFDTTVRTDGNASGAHHVFPFWVRCVHVLNFHTESCATLRSSNIKLYRVIPWLRRNTQYCTPWTICGR